MRSTFNTPSRGQALALKQFFVFRSQLYKTFSSTLKTTGRRALPCLQHSRCLAKTVALDFYPLHIHATEASFLEPLSIHCLIFNALFYIIPVIKYYRSRLWGIPYKYHHANLSILKTDILERSKRVKNIKPLIKMQRMRLLHRVPCPSTALFPLSPENSL